MPTILVKNVYNRQPARQPAIQPDSRCTIVKVGSEVELLSCVYENVYLRLHATLIVAYNIVVIVFSFFFLSL